MNTRPSSTPHLTSTTESNRPRSDQDQPQVDATERVRAAGERALVLGGGGSTGNAWLIGVIAGLFDAGLDVTTADLTIGTSAGSTTAVQIAGATPPELLAATLAAAPQQRTGPVGSDRGRVPNRPVADHLERISKIIASAEDAADMRRKMGAAALDDLSLPGLIWIDGVTKNIGTVGYDYERIEDIWTELISASEEFGDQLQLIVAANNVPERVLPFLRLDLDEDNRLIPESDLTRAGRD